MDANVAQIVSITSTTPERAAQYLQLADGDLDAAVMLYFESDGVDPSGAPTTNAEASSTSNQGGFGDVQNTIDDDDQGVLDSETRNNGKGRGHHQPLSGQSKGTSLNSDEEYARKLQDEMYGGLGRPGTSGEHEVRAPIARQTETLLGPGAEMGGLDDEEIPAQVMNQMQRMQNRRGQRARAGIFNQRPTTSAIWNEQDEEDAEAGILSESTGGASATSSRSTMLAKMYQPPWDLMFRGGWESAREEGREQQKWMLVNIQDGSVFDCQVLNRDLWKNPSVVETVRENFIFLQYSKDDIRAEQYLQYYFQGYSNPDLYPHIAIVDPRTGEQVKVWSAEVPKSADFLMQLHEFLDRYSLSSNARNPVAKRKAEVKKPKSVDQMTEEEQVEKAMQASLAAQSNDADDRSGTFRVEDPDDLTKSFEGVPKEGGAEAGSSSAGSQNRQAAPISVSSYSAAQDSCHGSSSSHQITSPFSLIPSDRPHTEPTSSDGPTEVTRIQFRHPGGRVIRRFSTADPVQRIFEWLKADPSTIRSAQKDQTGSTMNSEFELVSMGKNLIAIRDMSIEEAGLKNGTVMVELVEG